LKRLMLNRGHQNKAARRGPRHPDMLVRAPVSTGITQRW
jgi:hypothetical protein